MQHENLRTEEEAAKILRCSKEKLRQLRRAGRGPAFVRYGPRIIRYTQQAIEGFIQEHTSGPSHPADGSGKVATAAKAA